MQDPDDIHRYLTEQIVGPPTTVVLGPADHVQVQPGRRPFVQWFHGRLSLVGVAVHSLWADPAAAAAGQPLNLPGLVRWRRGLALGLVTAWTLAVAGGTAWWLRH